MEVPVNHFIKPHFSADAFKCPDETPALGIQTDTELASWAEKLRVRGNVCQTKLESAGKVIDAIPEDTGAK